MAKKKNPLLDFSTVANVTRDYILIDGEACEIKSKEEIGLRDYAFLQKEGRKILSIYSEGDYDGDKLQDFVQSMDDVLELIFVDVPKETLLKLTTLQQFQVIEAFIKLLTVGLPEGAIEEATKKAEAMMKPKTEAQKMREQAKRKAPQKRQAKKKLAS